MREEGYYLVNYCGDLIIAQWFNKHWWLTGREDYFDDTWFDKIYEKKINLENLERQINKEDLLSEIDDIDHDVEILYALLDDIHTKHGVPKEHVTETIPCPKCKTGTVTYHVSKINGHSCGKCSTENCLNWQI